VAVENTGAERRLVPDRRGALLGAGGEVRLEPLLLGRPRARVHVVVDRDHVPGAEVVAVVSLRRVPRSGTEIVVVSRSARGGIVVIARYRPGARLVPPPGWTVAIGKLGCRPVGIGVVARGVHRALDDVEQRSGGFVLWRVADGNVAGPDERRSRRRHHGHRVAAGHTVARRRDGRGSRGPPEDVAAAGNLRDRGVAARPRDEPRSEEHTSE